MTTISAAYGFSTHEQVAAYLSKAFGLDQSLGAGSVVNENRLRRERIAQRIRLYRDDGRLEFERLIDRIFTKTDVRDQRKVMIDVATENNVTQRIINEVASLYDQPAVRTLKSKDDQVKLKQISTDLELDEVMQEAQRLTFLCNETLLWRSKILTVITPDVFDAIPNPAVKLEEVGFIIDNAPIFVADGADRSKVPHYEVWDEQYQYLLNVDGRLIDVVEHKLGQIPGVLLHRRKPIDRILDDRAGRDITAAHLGVGLLEVMAMRLMKSQGERQPILKGNLASMAMGQSMDGEKPLLLPPEVTADMLDTQTDPDHYMRKKKDKIAGVAQNYGMSYEQFVFSETTMGPASASGKAYEVRRMKLTELRNEQRRRALVHERRIITMLGLSSDGMLVDFQEQTVPQDAMEEIALLKERMPLGLDSPVKYYMRKNPDATRDEAIQALDQNMGEYALSVLRVRALNMPLNADASNPGQSPQQNGAQGGPSGAAPSDAGAESGAAAA
jgi:hypothetical protein